MGMKLRYGVLAVLLWGTGGAAWGSTCYFDHVLMKEVCHDPVTNAPGSAMVTTTSTDFDLGFVDIVQEDIAATAGQELTPGPAFGVGLTCGWFRGDNTDTSQCTVPLSYTIRNEIDPRRRLTLKMPITRLDFEGSSTTHVGLGAAYTYPFGARWYVTPSLSYTLANKGDFLSKANLLSASVTSAYFYKAERFDVGIGNMLGYNYTVNEDGWADPTLTTPYRGGHNLVLRNGILFAWPGRLLGAKSYWESNLVLTNYFGDKTFTDNQIELTLSVGNRRSAKVTAGGHRVGLTLIDTDNLWGAKLAWGYWF